MSEAHLRKTDQKICHTVIWTLRKVTVASSAENATLARLACLSAIPGHLQGHLELLLESHPSSLLGRVARRPCMTHTSHRHLVI